MNITLPIHAHLRCGDESPPHCHSCRADRAWRRNLVEFFGGAVDFDCPIGRPIIGQVTDEKVSPPPAPVPVARLTRTAHTEGVPAPQSPPRASNGPGTLLSAMIKAATGIDSAGCASCDGRRRQMDQWGWAGSIAHSRTIFGWLKDECVKRGITPDRRMIWKAIKGALRSKPEGQP